MANNPNDQARFLRAGIEQLKDYLLSNELFWNVGQSQQLTLGNLLLAKTYLDGAGHLDAADAEQLEATKQEWGSAWQAKAQAEFKARLRQWTQALNEMRQQPAQHAAYYATEVRLRALLELLKAEIEDVGDTLAGPDQILKALLMGEDFVWGPGAAKAFPADRFWFLYGRPQGRP